MVYKRFCTKTRFLDCTCLKISIMNLICGYFNLPPSIGVCRAFIGLYLIGGAVRYAFMATSTIVIFLLVRLKNAVKFGKFQWQ